MIKFIFTLLFIFSTAYSVIGAKMPDGDKILKEGQLLYRLEKASWYGTDHFLEKYAEMRDSLGGYLSYKSAGNKINTIFFKKSNPFHILARYEFDSLPKSIPVSIDTENIEATEIEKDLIEIRQDAMNVLRENAGHFFSFYQNTSFNLIPLISGRERKVYILTGPKSSNVVLLGNDYLLTYDKKNNLKKKAKLHNTIIELPAGADAEGQSAEVSMHTHVVSEVIDATDICTILLYRDYVQWKQHIVISDKYVSLFDLENEKLLILTKKAWDRVAKHQAGER